MPMAGVGMCRGEGGKGGGYGMLGGGGWEGVEGVGDDGVSSCRRLCVVIRMASAIMMASAVADAYA